MDTKTIIRWRDVITEAQITACELMDSGSNYVFAVALELDREACEAVYKPRDGEAPLWDFPEGTLYKREYAAFLVSQELGWELIPPTVVRDGPYGIGSMQYLIEMTEQDVVLSDVSQGVDVFKKVAVFDIVTNNADRKMGHFLVDQSLRLWLIDHGLTFNAEPKLRTVLWDFAGETVPDEILGEIKKLLETLQSRGALRAALAELIDEAEIAALELRIRELLDNPVFPEPVSQRSIPWPWY